MENEFSTLIGDLNMLEENGALSSQPFNDRADWMSQLKQINSDNARKWLTRAKTQHFQEGDANTKYFHTLSNGRRRRNTIQKITINGMDDFNQANIMEEITNYFFNLFQDKHEIRPQMNS